MIHGQVLGNVLTESEIIGLASKFLEPGFHELPVTSMEQGRGLITTFLGTLDYYKAPACLSQQKAPESVLDLYEIILSNQDVPLTELFCTQIQFDFLWIELTPDMQSAPWFDRVMTTIGELGMDKTVPIMLAREFAD